MKRAASALSHSRRAQVAMAARLNNDPCCGSSLDEFVGHAIIARRFSRFSYVSVHAVQLQRLTLSGPPSKKQAETLFIFLDKPSSVRIAVKKQLSRFLCQRRRELDYLRRTKHPTINIPTQQAIRQIISRPTCNEHISAKAASCPKCGHQLCSPSQVNMSDPVHFIGIMLCILLLMVCVVWMLIRLKRF